ncbi:hypothetical protein LTR66_012100 [Elasticomyces elasticus]|nr:hypothetical protein LTR66_012100 [Elasticomyces elasticus]
MIGYLLALIPLYFFVYLPLSSNHAKQQPASRVSIDLNETIFALGGPRAGSCIDRSYSTHLLSRQPLVIYIEDFLSEAESKHLLEISESQFEPSLVWNGEEARVDPSVRISENALLDRDDVVKCIEERARAFQGWRPKTYIERLRTQRYGPSGHYVHHYDFSADAKATGWGRVSSFMVYVDADCSGGGTNFPRIRRPKDERWCEFIECGVVNAVGADGVDEHEGVTFKPIKGNAVFWENLKEDGSGYEETWHAGLPVVNGTKVGLNIWNYGMVRTME